MFERLRRRKLFQWGVAYVAASWVLVQVFDVVAEPWGIPAGLIRGTQAVLALALPAVLVLAWYHGERGRQRVSRAEAATLASTVLLSAVVLFVWNPFEEPNAGPTGIVSASVDPNSLLVLPFVNMSSDSEQDFMSDGVAEELLNLLAQIPELRVISRTTAFSFKGRDDVTLPEIAAQLEVAHVLEGSVRRSGNTLRITAQLIDTRSDTHLFSTSYDRTLDDIFAIQDDIAARVVDEIRTALLDEVPQQRETDPEAYALYLKARHVGRSGSYGDQTRDTVMAWLRRALDIDPEYPAVHLALARNYADMAGNELPLEEGGRRAQAATERALALDPDYAAARALLGQIMIVHQDDLTGGAAHIEGALAAAPADPDAIMLAGIALAMLGRFDESVDFFEYVAHRDPLNGANLYNLAFTHYNLGQWTDVAAASRAALELDPRWGSAQALLSVALLHTGDLEGALTAAELETNAEKRLLSLALVHHALGRQADFEAALEELRELEEAGAGREARKQRAAAHAYAGDVDAAFALLEDTRIDILTVVNPLLTNLHGDPRWADLVSRLHPSVEERAAIRLEVRIPR